MVRDILRLDLAVNSVSKTFEPSGENPKFGGHKQCQPKGFTVHMNSDMIFWCDFYDVE